MRYTSGPAQRRSGDHFTATAARLSRTTVSPRERIYSQAFGWRSFGLQSKSRLQLTTSIHTSLFFHIILDHFFVTFTFIFSLFLVLIVLFCYSITLHYILSRIDILFFNKKEKY